MKSPFKFNLTPVVLSAIIGLIVIVYSLFNVPIGIFPVWHIIILVFMFAVILSLGLIFTITSATIFNHKVGHPVELKDLIVGQTYWLNGETWAIYRGQNEFTGQRFFSIYGKDDPEKSYDVTAIYPDLVRRYISSVEETYLENIN